VRDLPTLLDRLEEAGGQAQAAASAQLPAGAPPRQRAYQLLRRHGQAVCRRKDPAWARCAIAGDCPSAGHPPPLY